MGPQKMEEIHKDIAGLKETLNFLSAEMEAMKKERRDEKNKMNQLASKVEELENVVVVKDEKINILEQKIHDLEQYSRKDEIIITGLKQKPQTYARAVAGTATIGSISEEDSQSEDTALDLESQVIKFLDSKDIVLDKKEISVCHKLKKRDGQEDANILVRLVSRKTKNRILSQGKNLRGSDVYINEHLSAKNAAISREARKLKRNRKIESTWTRNCAVYVKIKGNDTSSEKILKITEISQLNKFQ